MRLDRVMASLAHSANLGSTLFAGLQFPSQSPSSLFAMTQQTEAPKWQYVTRRFTRFIENISITDTQLKDGTTKHHGIHSYLNSWYYGHDDEEANSILIGSWGNSRAYDRHGMLTFFSCSRPKFITASKSLLATGSHSSCRR